jgi:hypothetical protein
MHWLKSNPEAMATPHAKQMDSKVKGFDSDSEDDDEFQKCLSYATSFVAHFPSLTMLQ